jgi:hypothetical protein
MTSILHIARQLPPAYDGVGDYLRNLWKAWPDRETQWHFAVQQGDIATRAMWPEVTIHQYQPNASSLSATLGGIAADSLVLHYVGYAFHPKGVPAWLPQVIGQWRRSHGGRVVTMFHELFAESSPLHSPFWLKPIARSIIRSLLRVSDSWIATCERNWDLLLNEFHANPNAGVRIPIGSNIPAAEIRDDIGGWPSKLNVAVFGLPPTRMLALQRHQALLRQMNIAGLLGETVLIGKRCSDGANLRELNMLKRSIGGAWREAADLPLDQIANELSRCQVGLVFTDVGILTKSTAFAALIANGVLPIVPNRDGYQPQSSLRGCLLLNNDTPDECADIVARFGNPSLFTGIRRKMIEAAQLELGWSRISSHFEKVIASK